MLRSEIPQLKVLNTGSSSNAIAKDSSQDITFDVRVRWDDNNVYIALQTPDEKLINLNTESSCGMEMRFSWK